MERREYRADTTVEGNRLVGHASVFNQEARIKDFWEQVDPAAFDRALREDQDVVCLANHDGLPLGRRSAGTLRLGTDTNGLTQETDLPDTTLGRDVRELVRRGDLRSMSFGFVVTDEDWSVREDGSQLRTIRDLDLFDVSVVTFPAYAGTDLALRFDESRRPKIHPAPITARDQVVRIRARIRRNG